MWDKPVWLDSGNFSVRVYLPLIWMFSATHMHSLTVYVITGLPFARYLSQESSPASNLCFWLALSHSAFFFLYLVTFFLFIHGFSFYFIKHRWHSLDQHLLKCLSLETLTSMIRTGSPILVEMVDLVNFVISNKRTQMVNFPTQIWEFDSHNPAILDFFFFWRWYLFCNGFPSLEKFWSCCCLSFHWRSMKFTMGCLFHCVFYEYSRADWDGLCDHLRDFPWEDIFKVSASATSREFS